MSDAPEARSDLGIAAKTRGRSKGLALQQGVHIKQRFKMILRSKQLLLWLALLFAHSSAFVPVSPLHNNRPALSLYAKKKKKSKRVQKKQAAKTAPAPPPAAPAPAPPPVAAPPPVTFDAAIAPEAAAPAAAPPVAAPPIAFADGAPTPVAFEAPAPPPAAFDAPPAAAFDAPAPPAAAFDAPPPAPAAPVTPAAAPFDEDLKSLIVDEPGKLFGQTADEQLFGARPKGAPAPKLRAKPQAPVEDDVDSKWPLPRLELPDFGSVEKIGGERPADPTDSFDYGVGGIVKKAVYATAFAAVIWEVYINSPFFERAAPPPAVTAVQEEMSKYQPPVEVEDPPQPPPEPIVPPPPATFE